MSLLKKNSQKPVFTVPGKESARRAAHILKDLDEYPHNIHPALVSGVSIDDQKIRYGVDKPLFAVVALLVLGFIAWGVVAPESVLTVSSIALTWTMENLGWVFNTLAIFLPIFLLVIGFSRFGKIPLGLDDEAPPIFNAVLGSYVIWRRDRYRDYFLWSVRTTDFLSFLAPRCL